MNSLFSTSIAKILKTKQQSCLYLFSLASIAIFPTHIQAQAPHVCEVLEEKLSHVRSISKTSPSQVKKLTEQYVEIDRAFQQSYKVAARRGCIASKNLFGGSKALPASCRRYTNDLSRKEKQRRAAYAQLRVAQGEAKRGVTPEKTLLRQLANAGCSGYKVVEKKVSKQNKGLVALLFGKTRTVTESQVIDQKKEFEYSHRYRTVCVRACDGYFFPVREVASRGHFGEDSQACQSQCPGAEAELYVQKLGANDVFEDMRSITGESYKKMDNAYRFQKEYVQGCKCTTPRTNVAYIDPEKLKYDLSKVYQHNAIEITEDDVVEKSLRFADITLPLRRPLTKLDFAEFNDIPRDRPGLLRTKLAEALNGYPTPIPKPELNAQISTLWIDLKQQYPKHFLTDEERQVAEEKNTPTSLNLAVNSLNEDQINKTKNGGIAFNEAGSVAAYDGRSVRLVGQPFSLSQ